MGASMALAGYTVTVPPGGEESLHVGGSSVRVVAATADFRLGVDADASVPFSGGLAFTMPPGREFEQLRIINPNAGAVTVSVLISAGEVHDARSTFAGVMSAAIVSMPAITIAAGQTVDIGAMPAVAISGTPSVAIPAPTQTAAVPDTTVTTTPAIVATGGPTVRGYSVRNVGSVSCRLASSTAGLGANTGLLLRAGEAVWLGTSANLAAVTAAGSTKLSIMVLLV